MAMSHADCDHPRTPAGRAACRKAGGPRPTTPRCPNDGTVLDFMSDGEMGHCAKCGDEWHIDGLHKAGLVEPPTCEGSVEAPQKPVDVPTKRRGTRRKALVGEARTRVVEHEHDLVNVPAAFGTVIRWAWDHNLGVRTGLPFNETERQIIIQSEHGWLTLVWRAGQPFGVTAVWWRPCDTSVQKRLMTVQQGLTALESGVWD